MVSPYPEPSESVDRVMCLPQVLLAVLHAEQVPVSVSMARGAHDAWRFRFAAGCLLEVTPEGAIWRAVREPCRARIDRLVEGATAVVAESRKWRGVLTDHGDVIAPWRMSAAPEPEVVIISTSESQDLEDTLLNEATNEAEIGETAEPRSARG